MRFELPAGLTPVHRMRLQVRWGDLDALGHVNNTVYLRWFETVRIDWLQGLGLGPDPAGPGPVMANVFCNFRREVGYPAELLATHWVAAPGRSSLDTFFTLADVREPDVVLADGGATLVWVDGVAKRSVPLPELLRAACVQGLGEP